MKCSLPQTTSHSATILLSAIAVISLTLASPGVRAQSEARPPQPPPVHMPTNASGLSSRSDAFTSPRALATDRPALLPEGAFLSQVYGQMRLLASGRYAFVFHPDPDGLRIPPMILLPNMNRAAMEQVIRGAHEDTSFRVSGQVYVYAGRNYFLATTHAVEAPPQTMEVSTPSAQDSSSTDDTPAPDVNDTPSPIAGIDDDSEPSVDDLIRQLDESTPRRTAVPAAAPSPDLAEPRLRREGEYLVLRRGPVVSGPSGEIRFTPNNDPQSPTNLDPPMTLLPCLNLQRIERLMDRSREPLTFVISGRVFVHDGVNYLLPTLFQAVAPASQLTLGQ